MPDSKPDFSDLLKLLHDIYENQMPFNRLLGIQILSLDMQDICVRVDKKPEFIGNYVKDILHGGVISSVIDLTGGIIASVGVLKRMEGSPIEEIISQFTRMGTIDLRVDYLRAGRGNYFLTRGSVLRTGNKVAVIRTEFRNDENLLIAAGTGTYLVG
jgi:uncharacterized protein (TIGR00369 family)